jgi:hypothetical protein
MLDGLRRRLACGRRRWIVVFGDDRWLNARPNCWRWKRRFDEIVDYWTEVFMRDVLDCSTKMNTIMGKRKEPK